MFDAWAIDYLKSPRFGRGQRAAQAQDAVCWVVVAGGGSDQVSSHQF